MIDRDLAHRLGRGSGWLEIPGRRKEHDEEKAVHAGRKTAATREVLLPRLNPDCRAVMNHFVYSMVNGLLGYPLLDSVDYRPVLMEEGSAAEQAAAIFCNVLELDEDGNPVNANKAEARAAQYIRAYCDMTYEVDPPFEDWELDRPLRKGKRLGPMP